MKKNEIKVGGKYRMKVSGVVQTVRVTAIRETTTYNGKAKTVYVCVNLATGRACKAESAAKFRGEVKDQPSSPMVSRPTKTEDEQRPNPTLPSVAQSADPLLTPKAGVTSVTTPSGPASSTVLPTSIQSKLAAIVNPTVDNAPHLIVEARAGSGKTTTLVEGLRYVLGGVSTMTPSPQQDAVWKEMARSAGVAKSVCFVAFNRSIADELKTRVPQGCEAMTMHSLGFRAVMKAFPSLRGRKLNESRTADILARMLGKDDKWQLRRDNLPLMKAVEELVGLCKVNLTSVTPSSLSWGEILDQLAGHYEIELNGVRESSFDLVPKVLDASRDPEQGGMIDFDDMIWLPVVLSLPVQRYDLLLVDEAQDLNRCQQALAKMAGKRLVLCGDPKQAIYGFAGADAESMDRMHDELANGVQLRGYPPPENGRGCITLPLTVTRRCGKAIVREANKIVPDFDAFETNPEGKISEATYPTDRKGKERPKPWYTEQVEDGDMVLCRCNAPLVSQCFRFLKAGRKANIQGRDVGKGLVSTVEKLCKDKTALATELITKLDDWLTTELRKEGAKRNPSEERIINLQDRRECLACFIDGAITEATANARQATVADVIRKIDAVFTDNKDKTGIRLSSIHKAKGLEAKRVFFLMPEGAGCPHPMAKSAWQQEQEMNLRYVAITRAIEELIFVY